MARFCAWKSYSANVKQRAKAGYSYSDWFKFIRRIPRSSVLGPLLFNIFIDDIFFELQKSKICNFEDYNTLYCCNKELQAAIENLTDDVKNDLTWLKINSQSSKSSEVLIYDFK